MLYPLKFKPLFKEKIWGGAKIKTKLNLDFSPLPNCGEAWVLSGVNNDQTKVSNGFLKGNDLNEILEIYMDELVGQNIYDKFGNEFPILVKFIDANDWLSIQVHPDDALAAKRGIGRGKTEMWYILDAEPDAKLISGFNRPLTLDEYKTMADSNRFREIMNFEEVKKDNIFFIPAGRVHALGPGILLAEIQQTSDTTYRVYDWDRVDAAGRPRELHTEQALEAFDFKFVPDVRTHLALKDNHTNNAISHPCFTTSVIPVTRSLEMDYSDLDSFVIYIVTEGSCELTSGNETISLKKGETVLLPAITETVKLEPKGYVKLLEVFME